MSVIAITSSLDDTLWAIVDENGQRFEFDVDDGPILARMLTDQFPGEEG